MRSFLMIGILIFSFVGCGAGKHDLERKYEQLKIDMTAEKVKTVMGDGKPVTSSEIASYPEYPKLNLNGLPDDTRWVRWGESYPYVLAGFSKDRLVIAQIVGVGPPKRLGQ